MKIIFLGTPEFALPSLKSLAEESDIEMSAVVTQPDKPVGRKQVLCPPPVKVMAEEMDIKVFQPKNKEELYQSLKDMEVDFFIVIAFGMILTEKILAIPQYGSINVHASILPKYRGASPIQQALLHGDHETGVSIMKMDEKLDHGPVYQINKIIIKPEDSLSQLNDNLANLGGNILVNILKKIIEQPLIPIEQKHQEASYCKKISKEDGKIDWNKSATEIINMMRAFSPWPGIYTDFHGKKLKIIKAEQEEGTITPGQFQLVGRKLLIGTRKGVLRPLEVQIEGKRISEVSDFINGNKDHLR